MKTLAAALFFATLTAQAEIKLPAVLADHMVLQRDKPVHLWGTATAGEKVHADFRNHHADTTADANGNWSITLPKGDAGGPFVLTINTLKLPDVLVGDVWLASGQSNMEFTLRGDPARPSTVLDVQKEIANVNLPNLRVIHVKPDYADTPQTDVALLRSWEPATMPDAVKGFSAVAYFFAKDILAAQKPGHQIPIGVIQSDLGSSPAEAWMSPEAFAADPTLKDNLRGDAVAAAEIKAAHGQHIAKTGKTPRVFFLPSHLYNAMIAPLENFPIEGVIWYQGEANSGTTKGAIAYQHVFSTLIRDWRAHWHEGDFPFYYVQLANFENKNDWPDGRESQRRTLALPNTGMAVAIDIGEPDNIHPRAKWITGYRLSLWARAKVYGEKIEYTGPLFSNATVSGNKITAHFTHAEGLAIKPAPPTGGPLNGEANPGPPLKGFEIAGSDGIFHPADAEIEGTTVVATSPQVPNPAYIRYAWAANPNAPLYNSADLPAAPFTSKP